VIKRFSIKSRLRGMETTKSRAYDNKVSRQLYITISAFIYIRIFNNDISYKVYADTESDPYSRSSNVDICA